MKTPSPTTPSPPSAGGAPRVMAVRAYFFTFAARGIRAAGRLLAFLCAARFFSVDETGNFAFAFTVGTLAGIVADLGFSEFLNREIPTAGQGSAALERHALLIRLASIPLGTGGAWLVVLAFDPGAPAATIGTLLFCVAVGAADFLGAVRRAHKRNELEALESSLPTLAALGTAGLLGLLGVGFGTFQLALGLSAATLVVGRILVRLRETRGAADSASAGAAPTTLGSAWSSRYFLLRTVSASLLFEMPMLMLKAVTTPATVAFYAAALRPVGFVTLPFVVLGNVFTPALAHDSAAGGGRLSASTRRLNLLALLMAPTGYATCLLGGELLLLAFGRGYLAAQSILAVLALAFMVFFCAPSAVPLVILGRERTLVLVALVAAAVMAAVCAVLLPGHGAEGAAFACLVVFALIKAVHVSLYRRQGLAAGDLRHLIALACVLAWFAALSRLDGAAAMALLLGGGAASGLLLLHQLRRTTIFT